MALPEIHLVAAVLSCICAIMISLPLFTRWSVANITIDELLRRMFDDDVPAVEQLLNEHEHAHAIIVIRTFLAEGYEPAIARHDKLESIRHRHRALLLITLLAALWATYFVVMGDRNIVQLLVSVVAMLFSGGGIWFVELIDHTAG